MRRERDWTDEEVRVLLANRRVPATQLSGVALDRSPGAIDWVRAGIERYARGRDTDILSASARQVLDDERLGEA
jgi:hypothetical protein